MAPTAVATPFLLTDPGYLFGAPLGTTEPANTVAGSVFTDAWAVAWIPLGATVDGSTLSYQINIEAISVAEFFDPIAFKTTSRQGSFAFSMADADLHSVKRAYNGGMGVIAPTSGTGATALGKVEPPDPGTELRIMLGWESLDNTARVIMRQCIQGGEVQMQFQKAPAFAAVPAAFSFEVPAAAKPFSIYSAGASRLGA
jgi:hypothetical protein